MPIRSFLPLLFLLLVSGPIVASCPDGLTVDDSEVELMLLLPISPRSPLVLEELVAAVPHLRCFATEADPRRDSFEPLMSRALLVSYSPLNRAAIFGLARVEEPGALTLARVAEFLCPDADTARAYSTLVTKWHRKKNPRCTVIAGYSGEGSRPINRE